MDHRRAIFGAELIDDFVAEENVCTIAFPVVTFPEDGFAKEELDVWKRFERF